MRSSTISLVLFSLLACGGLDLERARKGGFFDPEKWFPGRKTGYGQATDRNGNVVLHLLIQRDCQTPDQTSGTCIDRVETPTGTQERTLAYRLEYLDNLDVTVQLKSESAEHLSGLVYGNQMVLEGKKQIPGSERMASVVVHFDRMSLGGGPVWQRETYSYGGMAAGQVQIFWQNQ